MVEKDAEKAVGLEGRPSETASTQHRDPEKAEGANSSKASTLNNSASSQPSTAVGVLDSDEDEFEVAFDGPDDPYNPKAIRKGRKWLITFILSLGSLCWWVPSFLASTCPRQSSRN